MKILHPSKHCHYKGFKMLLFKEGGENKDFYSRKNYTKTFLKKRRIAANKR
jgi:hypothetical protein